MWGSRTLSSPELLHNRHFWIVTCLLQANFSTDCFGIYDLNDDGYISREEMFQMLKNTMVKQPTEEDPDEGIKDLVETMVKKMVSMWAHLC